MTRQAHCLFGNFFAHAAYFEDDTPGFDNCYIMINGAFTTTHTCLSRLGRDRLVRKNANPHFAATLHEAGERDTRRFDLTGLQPAGLQSLQPKLTEGECAATLGGAFHATAMLLAVLIS